MVSFLSGSLTSRVAGVIGTTLGCAKLTKNVPLEHQASHRFFHNVVCLRDGANASFLGTLVSSHLSSAVRGRSYSGPRLHPLAEVTTLTSTDGKGKRSRHTVQLAWFEKRCSRRFAIHLSRT